MKNVIGVILLLCILWVGWQLYKWDPAQDALEESTARQKYLESEQYLQDVADCFDNNDMGACVRVEG